MGCNGRNEDTLMRARKPRDHESQVVLAWDEDEDAWLYNMMDSAGAFSEGSIPFRELGILTLEVCQLAKKRFNVDVVTAYPIHGFDMNMVYRSDEDYAWR